MKVTKVRDFLLLARICFPLPFDIMYFTNGFLLSLVYNNLSIIQTYLIQFLVRAFLDWVVLAGHNPPPVSSFSSAPL